MRSINALKAGDLARGLAAVRKDIDRLNAEVSGANSEPMRAAANVFVRTWRRLLSVAGSGTPSAPGQPPRQQLRHLRRSIGTAIVNGIRRVGSSLFTSRLHEFGYTARDGTTVASRPHGRVALELAAPEMTDVLVSEAQKRIAKAA